MDKIKKAFDKLNVIKLNEILSIGSKILKIFYILCIFLLLYVLSLLITQLKILDIIGIIFGILSYLFIGFIIAWLLNPLITSMETKGLNRTISVIIVFVVLLIIIYIVCYFSIPTLTNQVKDIVASIPGMITDIKSWIEGIFDRLSQISLENLDSVKNGFFLQVENYATGIQTKLPEIAVNVISSIASGLGTILMSFVIGFYMCFNFDKISEGLLIFMPKRIRKDASILIERISETSYAFVRGTLIMVGLQLVTNSIAFSIIGLNGPLLMALICSITDLIPYIGPYIGGSIVAIIGFTQSPLTGILVIVFVLIFQSIQGNFLQPLVMSKMLNLHPVTVIISLLIFGYLWGILGMLVATPIAALIKVIYTFFDEKFDFFGYPEEKKKT